MQMSHRICVIITLLASALAQDPQPEDYAGWVDRINNSSLPLPSCAEIGIQETLGCSALCQEVGAGAIDVSNSRNVNGKFVCTCANKVACNDQPTCSQLTLQPGRVAEGCTTICGNRTVAVTDTVEYAGAVTAADPNMTHFVLECRCDGEVQCSDNLLFSDLSYPVACTNLSISSTTTCDDYCASTGGGLFDLGGNYSVKDGTDQGICDCMGSSTTALGTTTNIAQACSDVPVEYGPDACTLQNPCPTQPPSSGGGGGSGSGGSNGGSGSVRVTFGASVISAMVVGSVALFL